MTKEDLAKAHADSLYKLTLQKADFLHDAGHYEKLIPFLQSNNIDPEIYFGVLIIYNLERQVEKDNTFDFVGQPLTITGQFAIEIFEKLYKQKSQFYDIKGYVVSHYKGFQKESVLEAYELGETVIKRIQESRGFSREEALIFCTDFNLIPDLYILVCREFYGSMRYKFYELRPRLEDFIKRVDKHAEKLKSTIIAVRFELFPDLLKDAPTPPKKQKHHRDSGVTRMKAAWRDW